MSSRSPASPTTAPTSAPVRPAPSARTEFWLMLLVVLGVALAYGQVRHAGFIWDDDEHVTANPTIIGPLGLKEIWTTSAADYFPLVLTNFWVLHKLWGLNPLPYHVLNILLHAADAWLLWLVLRRLRVPGAWLGAGLWALHPVQVESVAWIAELKNTQSALFFLAAIGLFTRWIERTGDEPASNGNGARGFYAGALLCAIAAVLSKPSTVMLPVVLGLAVWWLRRAWSRRDLAALAPFFLLSALAGLWTIWEQKVHSNASGADWSENFPQRLIIAGRTVWFYLGKLAWPDPLIFVYPRWTVEASAVLAYAAPLLVAGGLGGAWWLAQRRGAAGRGVFFASAAFVALLFPVLGFFSVYYFRFSFVADHFQYLASMAPLALAGAALVRFLPGRASLAGVPLLVLLGALTWQQAKMYQDNATLWRTILADNPACWLAHTNYSRMLLEEGKIADAAEHSETAKRLKPDDPVVRHNLGNAQLLQGRLPEAIENLRVARDLNPSNADTRHSLGYALMLADQFPEAETELTAALRFRADFAIAHRHLAVLLSHLNRDAEALPHWRAAASYQPNDYQAVSGLGLALLQSEQAPEAVAVLSAAAQLRASDPAAHCHLALALATSGRTDAALQEVEFALKLDPTFAPAQALRAQLKK